MQTRKSKATFIDLKPELDDPDIVTLLAQAVGRPTVTRMEEVCQMYLFNVGWYIAGYKVGREVLGCIGYQMITFREAVIRHISVWPEHQRTGIGRAMVRHVIRARDLDRLTAETDIEVVEFYVRCGFAVERIPSPFPDWDRFRCTWQVPPPGEDLLRPSS